MKFEKNAIERQMSKRTNKEEAVTIVKGMRVSIRYVFVTVGASEATKNSHIFE